MAALDFPSAPTTGQIFAGGNGVSYQFNGVLWLATGASAGGDVSVIYTGATITNSATAQTLIFNTVQSGNAGGWYSASNGRYTPPAGRYYLHSDVSFAGTTASTHGATLTLRKNGVTDLANSSTTTVGAGFQYTTSVNGAFDANGTDYFEVRIVGSGASVSEVGGGRTAFFTAFPISGIKGPPGDLVTATGVIVDFAGSTAPSGWLICDGASYTTAAQAALFAVIGYTYGGSGSNFNVPDLGGRVTAGKEATATRLTVAGAGFSGATLGAAGGTQTHTLTIAQLAAHTHPNANETFTPSGGVQAGGDYNLAHGVSGATGSDQAHQNTQPTMIMNKIIKT